MQSHACVTLSVPVTPSARVVQISGLFDVPPTDRSERTWDVTLPLDERPWQIGMIVGPSGSGKSTLLRAFCGERRTQKWPKNAAVVDAFPRDMSVKDVALLLSSVGFSSPPSWLRPYRCLSTGEQFRVSVARTLAEIAGDVAAIDEFTSVVDRTVAQIGSAAVARTVRARRQRLIVATCHYDIEEWLQPDWCYDPSAQTFRWRALQCRPVIELTITRCVREEWRLFRQHHYLSAELSQSARCFLALWFGRPVAFIAVLPLIGFVNTWREHRTVCLPDFQGIGIGSAVSAAVASLCVAATRGRYRSSTTHPAFIAARNRSQQWTLTCRPSQRTAHYGATHNRICGRGLRRANLRMMATHEYIGPAWADPERARQLWETKPCAA